MHHPSIKKSVDWRTVDSPKKWTNEFGFFCREKQKSKKNKFLRLFFGRIYSDPICLWFYLTFGRSWLDGTNFPLTLKVGWFQNVLLVSSFGPKYQRKNLTNSALELEKVVKLGMAIPRRFSLLEESRNGNLPFLEDRGRKNLFLGEFRGMGCYFILLIFQDLLVFLVLLFGIITENTNLWDKNSIMIKQIPIFRRIFFLSIFFLWKFYRKCCTLRYFWYFRGPRGILASTWGSKEW